MIVLKIDLKKCSPYKILLFELNAKYVNNMTRVTNP